MMRPLFACVILLTLVSPAAAEPAGTSDPWPGYVSGGRFFRSIDWGVEFFSPPNADQQAESSTAGVLVRYSQPAIKGKPGWVITVLAGRVKDELADREMIIKAAEQLREKLGKRVSEVKVQPAEANKPGPVIGRITCLLGAERAAPDAQPIYRLYVYLKLRPREYLTLVGETAPASANALAALVDGIASRVTLFDPKQENVAVADAAERTAKLIGQLKAADWVALAGRAGPQWYRVYAAAPADDPKVAQPPSAVAKPAPVGWAYSAVVARGAGAIESIVSTRIAQGDTIAPAYRLATIDLATGEEQVREWSRVTVREAGADGVVRSKPIESFVTAHRKGGAQTGGAVAGSTLFEISDQTTGRTAKTYTTKIPSQPYLPVALQDLFIQKLVGQAGQRYGAFTFAQRQIAFATMEFAGVEAFESGGAKTQAARFLLRPAVSSPMTVRWTDPTGGKALRISALPDAWLDAVAEGDVPAAERHELTKPPTWP